MIIRAFLNYLYSNVARAKLVCPSQSGRCWLLGDHKEVAHGVRWVARHSNGPSSNAGVISNSQQEHSWCSPSGKPPEVALYRCSVAAEGSVAKLLALRVAMLDHPL